MSAVKELFREFKAIRRDLTFLDQACIEFPNGEEDPFTLDTVLTPKSGPFEGGKVTFRFSLPADYPDSPPSVSCLNKVYHPNISFDGSICFNMFDSEFNNAYRLEQYINGLLWLLQNPNGGSALNGSCICKGGNIFKAAVQMAIHGLPVCGESYPLALATEKEPKLWEQVTLFYDQVKIHEGLSKSSTPLSTVVKHCQRSKIPFLSALGTSGLTGNIITLGKCSRLHNVTKVANKLKTSVDRIVKELVLMVNNVEMVMVLTLGTTPVNFKGVLNALRLDPAVPVRIATPDEIEKKLGWTKFSVPFLGLPSDVRGIVDYRIMDLDKSQMVYTASGSPKHLIEFTATQFQNAIKKWTVSDEITFTPLQHIEISIPYYTRYGEEVKMAGSTPELGTWNTKEALSLQWNDGVWKGQVAIRKMNLPFQYKYIVTDGENVIRWEEISNRTFKESIPSGQSFILYDNWNKLV